MKTETRLTLNKDNQAHWRATVEIEDGIEDEPEWRTTTIDVLLNSDTIVCICGKMPCKTYAWASSGHIESEATIAAIKYLSWLTITFDRID